MSAITGAKLVLPAHGSSTPTLGSGSGMTTGNVGIGAGRSSPIAAWPAAAGAASCGTGDSIAEAVAASSRLAATLAFFAARLA